MPSPASLAERLRQCVEKHPDWPDQRVASAVRGSRRSDVKELRAAIAEGRTWEPSHNRKLPEVMRPAKKEVEPGTITLDQVRKRYDIVQAIYNIIAAIPPGVLIHERELCVRAAGKDNNRFRRAVENTPEFKAFRARLKLDQDSGEALWYWGSSADIAEAIRLRDE